MSEPPLNFTRKSTKSIGKLIILSITCAAIMLLDTRYPVIAQIKGYAATALYPLQWLANQPLNLYHNIREFTRTQADLIADNTRLNKENHRLELLLAQSSQKERELDELKKLYGLQQHGIEITGVAEVISNNKDPLADKLILNRGSRKGLREGDAVIDSNGLIGQITQVWPWSAELTLITNRRIIIPVEVARTGVRSLLYGSGDSVSLHYFPINADLRNGDILLTSGIDGVYPKGIPVAKVTQATPIAGALYYQTTSVPFSAFRSSRYVLVLPQQPLPLTSDSHHE